MIQAHIYYSGRVQGVGFRFTVQRFASDLDLAGWVKNTPDGRVEVLAEGPKEKVEKLCTEVEGYFGRYIRNKEIYFEGARGKFASFEITF